jgi:hypothetical protein
VGEKESRIVRGGGVGSRIPTCDHIALHEAKFIVTLGAKIKQCPSKAHVFVDRFHGYKSTQPATCAYHQNVVQQVSGVHVEFRYQRERERETDRERERQRERERE